MENYKGNIIINKKKNHQIFEKENFLIEKTREVISALFSNLSSDQEMGVFSQIDLALPDLPEFYEDVNDLEAEGLEERGLKEPNNEKELKKEESDNINKENQINVEEHKKENDLVLEKEKQLKTI